jgi:hypothetical protein
MSTPAPPVLRDIRRGEQSDVIEFIDETGKVLLARSWGVDEYERARTREGLLLLLAPLVEHPK